MQSKRSFKVRNTTNAPNSAGSLEYTARLSLGFGGCFVVVVFFEILVRGEVSRDRAKMSSGSNLHYLTKFQRH